VGRATGRSEECASERRRVKARWEKAKQNERAVSG
jgi:hypothetical protein